MARRSTAGRPPHSDPSGSHMGTPSEAHMDWSLTDVNPSAAQASLAGRSLVSTDAALMASGIQCDQQTEQRIQQLQEDYKNCRKCKECQTMAPSIFFCVCVDTHDLVTYHTQSVTLLQDVHELLKIFNAFLNDCGGNVCVHCSRPCPVALLDNILDHRLTSMITNASSYDDSFERFVLDNGHVMYRVKPQPRRCISILHFHSPLALNQGLVHPTQQQIQSVVHHSFQRSTGSAPREVHHHHREHLVFEHMQPVNLFPSCKTHLHGAGNSCGGHTGQDYSESVANYWWDDLGLGRYIAALSKQQTGGSVYLGISEELASPTRAWTEAPNVGLGQVFPGCRKKVRLDHSADHYLAEEENVPSAGIQGSGRYICQGVCLSPSQRESFQTSLLQKIRSEMLWFPGYPSREPVEFTFHPVGQTGGRSGDLCVVEMRVFKFHGVAFHDPTGVEAYIIRGVGPACRVCRLGMAEVMDGVHEFVNRSNCLGACRGDSPP